MNSRFEIINTPLAGLKLIHRLPLRDSRGYLERLFCSQELETLLGEKSIKQINHTLTVKAGTVRGLHFQNSPDAEIKMVSCIRGEVFDVAVDLRNGSPGFLKYHAEILSETNHKTLFIPEGFAHGFQTLTENCELIYFHTAPHVAKSEGALNVLDPLIGIKWPILISDLSDRDKNHSMLTNNFKGLNL